LKKVKYYRTESGKSPFGEWLHTLDPVSMTKVQAYITRLKLGAAKKNVRRIDEIFELKMTFKRRIEGVLW